MTIKQDRDALANQVNNTDHAINEFRIFLQSDKFQGIDSRDGSGNDWIRTGDVLAQLEVLRGKLLGIN